MWHLNARQKHNKDRTRKLDGICSAFHHNAAPEQQGDPCQLPIAVTMPTSGVCGLHGAALRTELKAMLTIAVPSAITSALRTAQALTDQAVLGHLTYRGESTPIYLDAAALALLWMQLTINIATRGMCSAINVLSSQASGASNPRLGGVWLHTGAFLFAPPLGLLVIGLWLLTGPVVGLFAANQTVGEELGSGGFDGPGDPIELAARYAHLSCVYVLPTLWMESLNQWLIAQRVIRLQLVVYACAFALNLVLNVLLVHGSSSLGIPGLGFVGSPLATTLTRVLQLLALLSLSWSRLPPLRHVRDACRRSRVCTFAAQAGPRTLATAFEEFALQIMGALAGRLGAVTMATHNAMLMAFFWLTAPMYGVGSATQQRMGYYLGAGQPRNARLVAGLCFIAQVGLSWCVAATLMLTRNEIGKLFSSSSAIIEMTARIAPLVAAAYCLVGVFYSSMAVLHGSGRPLPVALAFLIGSFAIAPALGYSLTFTSIRCCDFGEGVLPLYGIWFGLIGGYFVTTIISGVAVLRSNWEAISKKAQERAEVRGVVAGTATCGATASGDAVPKPQAEATHTANGVAPSADDVLGLHRDSMRAPLIAHDELENVRSHEPASVD